MTLRAFLPQVEPNERVRFLGALVGFMAVASACLIARTAGDSLFLSSYSRDLLSYMYIGTALLVSILSLVFGICTRKAALSRVIFFACGFLVLAALGLRLGLAHPWGGFRIAAYFLADLTVNGSTLLFWSFFGHIFNAREAKRLLGGVGAGATLSCILAGFLIRPYTELFGTANLLLPVALLILIFAGTVFYLSGRDLEDLGALRPIRDRQTSSLAYCAHLLKADQVRNLASLMLIGTVAVTLVDYQFKAAAQSAYQGQQLAAFFGDFYAAANIVNLFIQIFLVHQLLRRGGLLLTLCVLPAGLLVGSLGTVLSAAFGWIVATKFTVQTAAFTIDIAGLQVLFLGIKKQTYNQARALVEGICKPLAIGITGLTLVLLSGILPIYALASGVVALALLWLVLARSNYRAYVKGLIEALDARLLDLSSQDTTLYDKSIEGYTRQALRSASSDDLPYLFSILEELEDIDWTPDIRLLLQRTIPAIKVAALEHLTDRGTRDDLTDVLEHLTHPTPGVRRAAVSAAVTLGGASAVDAVQHRLQDPQPEVRAEAAAGLIGVLSETQASVSTLKSMLESEDPECRIAVAHSLSRFQLHGQISLLLKLLEDPQERVQLAAVQACAHSPDPRLVPALVSQLKHRVTAPAAADALATFGLLTLNYFNDHPDPSRVRELFCQINHLPAIMVRIGGVSALNLVQKVVEESTSRLPSDLVEAYSRLLEQRTSITPYLPAWHLAAHRQMRDAAANLETLHWASSIPRGSILCDALREEYLRHLRNLFALLEVRVEGVNMQMLYSELTTEGSKSRPQALEILDNVLPPDLKERVLALVEPAKSRFDNDKGSTPLWDLLQPETPDTVLVGALYAAGEHPQQNGLRLIRRFLRHREAHVRQTALYTLSKLESAQELREDFKPLLEDADPGVRRLAESLARSPQRGGEHMIIVEKMLFLRHVPLFSKMMSSEIGRIANIARETVHPAGSTIIQEGDHGDRMYLIVDGEILIHRGETPLSILKPKNYFGEMSIIDGEPRSASAKALSDCLVLCIEQRDFQQLLATHADVAMAVINTLNQRLRETSSTSRKSSKENMSDVTSSNL